MAFADTAGMVAYSAKLIDDIEVFAATASTGWLAILETAKNDLAADKARLVGRSWDLQRGRLAATVTTQVARSHYNALLAQMADDISFSEDENNPLWAAIYDHMRTNTLTFKERDLTFGSASFSGTGTGTLAFVTSDEQGHEMQAVFADSYKLKCIRDGRRTGYQAEEIFQLSGTTPTLDGLDQDGGGVGTLTTFTAVRPNDSRNMVKNAMFADMTLSGSAVTAATGWTISGSGNLESDTTNLFYSANIRGISTYQSLKFTGNETISQDLVVDARKRFDLNAPYYCAVLLRRNSSATGTLTIDFGGQQRAVTIGSLTDNEWHLITVPSTIGQNSWFLNINQNTLNVQLALTSLAVDTISVAAVWCVKMQRWGHLVDQTSWGGRGCVGHYGIVIPAASQAGAYTPFVADDEWTWTYSEGATRGKVQYWAARSALGYFRHSATPSYADQ